MFQYISKAVELMNNKQEVVIETQRFFGDNEQYIAHAESLNEWCYTNNMVMIEVPQQGILKFKRLMPEEVTWCRAYDELVLGKIDKPTFQQRVMGITPPQL